MNLKLKKTSSPEKGEGDIGASTTGTYGKKTWSLPKSLDASKEPIPPRLVRKLLTAESIKSVDKAQTWTVFPIDRKTPVNPSSSVETGSHL